MAPNNDEIIERKREQLISIWRELDENDKENFHRYVVLRVEARRRGDQLTLQLFRRMRGRPAGDVVSVLEDRLARLTARAEPPPGRRKKRSGVTRPK